MFAGFSSHSDNDLSLQRDGMTAFEALYANIPGIKVVSPSTGYDAKGLLKQAIRYEEDPVMFMESDGM